MLSLDLTGQLLSFLSVISNTSTWFRANQDHPDGVMIAMIAPVAFLSGLIFKVVFVATWKASCGKVSDVSRDTQTVNLSRNVSKSYA